MSALHATDEIGQTLERRQRAYDGTVRPTLTDDGVEVLLGSQIDIEHLPQGDVAHSWPERGQIDIEH
jgi:hypothetical protein